MAQVRRETDLCERAAQIPRGSLCQTSLCLMGAPENRVAALQATPNSPPLTVGRMRRRKSSQGERRSGLEDDPVPMRARGEGSRIRTVLQPESARVVHRCRAGRPSLPPRPRISLRSQNPLGISGNSSFGSYQDAPSDLQMWHFGRSVMDVSRQPSRSKIVG